MSIASEIERLYGVRADILQAISDKGVTVPAGSKLDDCPELIAAIQQGGSSAYVPDVLTDEGVFKNFLPIRFFGQSNTKVYFDSDLIYEGNNVDASAPVLVNCVFAPTIDDTFEIAITFKKNFSYGTSGRCLIGAVNSYYKNFTVEYNGTSFFVGIPATGTNWDSQITLNATLTVSQWYTVKIRQENRIIEVSCYDDSGNLVASGTKNNYSLISRGFFETFQLGGCYRSSSIKWTGSIDMKKTYIKVNGQVLWGCEPQGGT